MQQKDFIPTYNEALEALRNGNDKVLEQALFAFERDDMYYVEQVTEAIRALLRRADVTPEMAISIGHALLGLDRLPLRTPGMDIRISLVVKTNNDATSYDFFISTDRFATESGGYIDSGYGTDSFSGNTFEVENEFRSYDGYQITSERWADIFNEMDLSQIKITDDSDDSILDWEHTDGSEFWGWIANHD